MTPDILRSDSFYALRSRWTCLYGVSSRDGFTVNVSLL